MRQTATVEGNHSVHRNMGLSNTCWHTASQCWGSGALDGSVSDREARRFSLASPLVGTALVTLGDGACGEGAKGREGLARY